MPLFEYRCLDCGVIFEKLQKESISEQPTCSACGSTNVQKEFSSFASPGGSNSSAGCFSGG